MNGTEAPAPIPREQLLLKLLKLTTSTTDAEALAAIRKANELLSASGWDWDKLFAGKIKVIESPFAGIRSPTGSGRFSTAPGTAPGRPRAPEPPPPPPQPTQKPPVGIFSSRPNGFAGFCYCCGADVLALAGFIFKPKDHNAVATDKWKVACRSCNNSATVRSGSAKPSVSPATSKLL